MTPLKRASQMQGMKNNKELQNLLKEEMKEDQNMEEKGCTANVVLYVPEDTITAQPATVFCANAGDSRCVMGSLGKATGLSLNKNLPTQVRDKEFREQEALSITRGE